ncbi:MAG: RNA methyltransferase [Bacilli bacterium]|jgi:TrmH family RNA methyltransferase
MIQEIKAKDNRRIVEAAKLKMSKYQDETGLFLVEGFHLLEMAVAHKAAQCAFTTKAIDHLPIDQFIVSEEILRKLAVSKTPQGVVAVCHKNKVDDKLSSHLIYLDEISDPGNLGTILRTALAFGYRDVLLSQQSVSPFNDKAITASQGALFALNIAAGDSDRLLALKKDGYQLIATSLQDSIDLQDAKIEGRHIVILGNESRGVSEKIKALADLKVKIAISGIDSLNVAVASGIVLYEASKKAK